MRVSARRAGARAVRGGWCPLVVLAVIVGATGCTTTGRLADGGDPVGSASAVDQPDAYVDDFGKRAGTNRTVDFGCRRSLQRYE